MVSSDGSCSRGSGPTLCGAACKSCLTRSMSRAQLAVKRMQWTKLKLCLAVGVRTWPAPCCMAHAWWPPGEMVVHLLCIISSKHDQQHCYLCCMYLHDVSEPDNSAIAIRHRIVLRLPGVCHVNSAVTLQSSPACYAL